ncbi:hypothetical protein QBC39DRAFT_367062 [Podospora conica]|nr:hypothetical protein QBC39DRAFT_367062 [Schizothecium conicum]
MIITRTLRPGLPADLDGVTDVIIEAMPDDPQWDYRFPKRLEFPEDHKKYTKMLLQCFLDPQWDDWAVMVVEEQDPKAKDQAPRIVSFGVFDVSYKNKRREGPSYKTQDPVTLVNDQGGSSRRDVNHEHFDAFRNEQIKAYERNFGGIGPDQIHLQILATLRSFRGRGHASSICQWAMDLVCSESEALKDVSVMASPMGFGLYKHLQFTELEAFDVHIPGEEERLTLRAMIYRRPKTKSEADGMERNAR